MNFARYLTILPSIHLSIVLNPDESVAMRHPDEVKAAVPFLQPGFWQDGILDSAVTNEDDAKPEDASAGEEASTSSNKSSPLDMVFQRLVSIGFYKVRLVWRAEYHSLQKHGVGFGVFSSFNIHVFMNLIELITCSYKSIWQVVISKVVQVTISACMIAAFLTPKRIKPCKISKF